MRVLLLHPEDAPFDSRWSASRWDMVVDFGWAGRSQYEAWKERFHCPVHSLFGLGDWLEDIRQLKQLFSLGNGSLVDSEGIDWWTLVIPERYQKLHEFLLLQKIASHAGSTPELYVTRPHPMADTLGKLLAREVKLLNASQPVGLSSRFHRYRIALQTLTLKQIAIIAGDKWDSDYKFRRLFAWKPKLPSGMKILLPTAYRNVSRAVVAYATMLPETNFLLVATRADGLLAGLPAHIRPVRLAAYAPVPKNSSTEKEIASLTSKWKELENNLSRSADPTHREIAVLLNHLPSALQNGLRIRDAWRRVFESESIGAVLCGDENNRYTRLPVLLARNRGVWTVHSSHGALDASIMLNGVCSDIYLVRGEMEGDYLVQGGVPGHRIYIGSAPMNYRREVKTCGNDIYFFSEPYELYSGRTELLYQELLANLCQVARSHDCRVIVKLHPFESAQARGKIVDRVVKGADRGRVEISPEPITEKLLQRIWFAVTVESSAAVECAIAGVPCFLCGWFDLDLHAYGRQYAKFGAARRLESPAEVLHIPDLLNSWPGPENAECLYHPATRAGLTTVFERCAFP